ncbi:hypothetical protein [Marinilabilia sp.]|uniref:hypothetical protein n=1 Tax=Marinilabilia sp. TaxID=2021252 RepID=UPI0025BDCD33|nr:hypothetical protein [Marinilabilia sp.]
MGNKFAQVGDDFKLLEIWKVSRKREVDLITFSENGDVLGVKVKIIDNEAIEISRTEKPSNIFVWETDKYVWLHTSD